MNLALPIEIVSLAESGAPRFAVSVLGPMRAAAGGLDIKIRKRKARALLAYLALTDGRQETRERLVGLLWSESEEEKARSSLRQLLHELGENLESAGFDGLDRSRLRIVLDENGLEVDAQVILDMARAGKIHPRLIDETLISESYLRDLDDIDPAFAVWAKARRQGFHDHLLRSLEAVLRSSVEDRATRRECAQAILNLDPTHEDACRVFMRLSAEIGDVAAAQRAYKVLWDTLGSEYDAEPSEETVALIAEIKQGLIAPAVVDRIENFQIFPQPEPLGEPGQSEPGGRVALLIERFGMNGIDPDSQHLADGFRHDLTACLVRFREWFVVQGSDLSAEQVAAGRVTTAYCVAATAYRAGDAMSLVLTLRERESGIHVWSDRYVLTLSNWFESQQQIVRQIAISLNVQVSIGRLARISREPIVALPVYDLWLRGQAALNRFSAENWKTAAQMFTAAIQRAPDFAPAHSSLAQMNNVAHFVHPGIHRSRDAEQRTLALARKSVELDPMDSRSHLALGWSLAMAKSYKQAQTHMDLARQLNPSDSWTIISTALCHAYCGDVAVAAQLAQEAFSLTLAPSALHWAYRLPIYFLRGDFAETIDAAERAEPAALGHAWHAAALALSGNRSAARDVVMRFKNTIRSNWFGHEPPTDEAIGRWVLHAFPLADAGAWGRVVEGLTAAGLSHGGARHHGW